jgi:hypothetical protein
MVLTIAKYDCMFSDLSNYLLAAINLYESMPETSLVGELLFVRRCFLFCLRWTVLFIIFLQA